MSKKKERWALTKLLDLLTYLVVFRFKQVVGKSKNLALSNNYKDINMSLSSPIFTFEGFKTFFTWF